MNKGLSSYLGVAILCVGFSASAVETTSEKVTNDKDKAVDTAKETYRNAKDEICELVNGKMECVAKKVKHKLQTAADKAKTKAKDVKSKVN